MQGRLGSGVRGFDNQGVLDDILAILRQPVIALVGFHFRARLQPQPTDPEREVIGHDPVHGFASDKGGGINDGKDIYHLSEEPHHLCLLGCGCCVFPAICIGAGALRVTDGIGIAVCLSGLAVACG